MQFSSQVFWNWKANVCSVYSQQRKVDWKSKDCSLWIVPFTTPVGYLGNLATCIHVKTLNRKPCHKPLESHARGGVRSTHGLHHSTSPGCVKEGAPSHPGPAAEEEHPDPRPAAMKEHPAPGQRINQAQVVDWRGSPGSVDCRGSQDDPGRVVDRRGCPVYSRPPPCSCPSGHTPATSQHAHVTRQMRW